ncbi:MAG: hypothetical protein Q9221_007059 [Calogaya cf. arnoldii]
MPNLQPSRARPTVNACSSFTPAEAGHAAECHNTWLSKVDHCRVRLKLMENGKMDAPETSSPDFTDIKDAIMHAIKPYENLEEVEPKDKFVAISYNMAYDHLIARNWPSCEVIAQILRLTCLDPNPVGSAYS